VSEDPLAGFEPAYTIAEDDGYKDDRAVLERARRLRIPIVKLNRVPHINRNDYHAALLREAEEQGTIKDPRQLELNLQAPARADAQSD
jgi:hypothetical protein